MLMVVIILNRLRHNAMVRSAGRLDSLFAGTGGKGTARTVTDAEGVQPLVPLSSLAQINSCVYLGL